MKIFFIIGVLCVGFCGREKAQDSNSVTLTHSNLVEKPWEHYVKLGTNSAASKTNRGIARQSAAKLTFEATDFEDKPPKFVPPSPNQIVRQPNLIIVNTNTYPLLHATDGRVYEFMGFDYVEPDGLTIKYFERGQLGGIKHVKIDFENLTSDLQKYFKYDPKKAAEYKSYQASIRQTQAELEYEAAKEQYEETLKEQQLETQIRIAKAQERQAEALEDQNFQHQMDSIDHQYQQQMDSIDHDFQQQEMQQKLDDIDWDLWDLRNH